MCCFVFLFRAPLSWRIIRFLIHEKTFSLFSGEPWYRFLMSATRENYHDGMLGVSNRHISKSAFTHYLSCGILIANTEFVDEASNSINCFKVIHVFFFGRKYSYKGRISFGPRTPGAVERSAARVGLICDKSSSTAAAAAQQQQQHSRAAAAAAARRRR